MNEILFCLLAMVAGLALIALFVRWYTGFCYRAIVGTKGTALNALLDGGRVPTAWRQRYLERFCPRLARRRYIAKLRGVERFVKGNRRLKNAEKAEYMQFLAELRAQWRSAADIADMLDE